MTEPAQPLFDLLEILDDLTPHDAELNMAVDEVLLENLSDLPLLRIYRWARPSVSLGYFTPWKQVATDYPQHDWVRRWTGGGVVEHGEDITYSLLVPRSHPLTNLRAGESYRLIHAALRTALIAAGWERTVLAGYDNAPVGIAAGACFANPVHHDLLVGQQKIGGGAQRRTRRGLLHQGSVQRQGIARIDADTIVQALPTAFARQWQQRFLSADEESASGRLAEAKYGDDRWLQRV